MLKSIFATVVLLAACSNQSTEPEEQTTPVTVSEHCTDAVHCDTSEVVAMRAADTPGAPEHVHPRARTREIECNGIDEDGDGVDFCSGDADHDGIPTDVDCNDTDATVHPGASETLCDGVDQNCDGHDSCDSDHDGVLDEVDCDPSDARKRLECHTAPAGRALR
jgi:hypothetical protein